MSAVLFFSLFLNTFVVYVLPSKQKLEFKSSKTRLLPSRSGVLIEFQSGVFTGNSRAISWVKTRVSPS